MSGNHKKKWGVLFITFLIILAIGSFFFYKGPSNNHDSQKTASTTSQADKVNKTTDENGIRLVEKQEEVDYTKEPEEILTHYTEEGMSLFKSNYPDTLSMEFALLNIGRPIDSFKGVTASGKSVSSNSLKGKNYIINISKTTCAVCKKTLPILDKMSKKEKLTVLHFYPMDKRKNVLAARKKAKVSNKMVLSVDKNKWLKDYVIDTFKVKEVPTLLFVDKTGRISYIYIGEFDSHVLSDMKDKAFNEKKLYEYLRTNIIKVDKDGNVVNDSKITDKLDSLPSNTDETKLNSEKE